MGFEKLDLRKEDQIGGEVQRKEGRYHGTTGREIETYSSAGSR